jgi:hypothetical protein
LIGPVTDFLTFYADLGLAIRSSALVHPGDHFYQKYGAPNSWADGTKVILGEDSIDFDLTLAAVDTSRHVATIVVQHVPPAQPAVHLPADWMHAPVVSGSANNWVQVAKENGALTAAVGVETFRDGSR